MTLDISRRIGGLRSPAAVLESAAERVAAQIDGVLPSGPDDNRPRRVEQLARLVEALDRVLDGEAAEAVRQRIAPSRWTLALLEALGRELIEGSRDLESAVAALEALSALARLRDALISKRMAARGAGSDAAEEDAAGLRAHDEDLRSRMRDTDAFELLVEVAHDFRSPLTSILFLAETLRDGHSGEVTDLQRSQLGLMYSAAFGLAAVASDVMDLARKEKGLLEDDPEHFALSEIFHNVVRMVQPIVEEKGLDLQIVVPEHARALGHAHALSRVLLNLTTNALKFTDEGHVELGVRRLPRDLLEYYVQDTGRGIPEERQQDLFQPFKRRLGRSDEGHFFSGSGVGLSIARRLVEAMGGELVFETSDERGTRFSFALPVTGRPR